MSLLVFTLMIFRNKSHVSKDFYVGTQVPFMWHYNFVSDPVFDLFIQFLLILFCPSRLFEKVNLWNFDILEKSTFITISQWKWLHLLPEKLVNLFNIFFLHKSVFLVCSSCCWQRRWRYEWIILLNKPYLIFKFILCHSSEL